MNVKISQSIKEEIRRLRKDEEYSIIDIYKYIRGKGIEITKFQCSAIASWASPKLAAKRKENKESRARAVPLENMYINPQSVSESSVTSAKPMDNNTQRTSAPSLLEGTVKNSDTETLTVKESWSNNEGSHLSKAEALDYLAKGYNPKKMAGYFKGRTESQYQALKSHIGMGTYAKNPALLEDTKLEQSGERKPIRKKEDLIPFLAKNEIARDMSLLALTLGADGGQIEEAIMELYQGKFKSREELHELLEETRDEMARIIREGVTNLGAFMGPYTLFDRRMAPIILGGVTNAIPLERVTPPLEKMLLRVAHGLYDPIFNRDTDGTIKDLTTKAGESVELAQRIYTVLVQAYQRCIGREKELKAFEDTWRAEHPDDFVECSGKVDGNGSSFAV